MAQFGNINVDPQLIPILQGLIDSGDPESLNVAQRVSHGSEFGESPDVMSILRRLLPAQFGFGGTPLQGAGGGQQDLGGMSDQDLMTMAGGMGIDTGQFSFQPSPVDTAMRDVSSLTPGISQQATPFDVNRDQVSLPQDVRDEVAGIFGAQRSLGQEELRRQTVELAGQRGLGFGDADIPQRVAQQLASMESGLRGQESQALLGLSEQARQNILRQREFGSQMGEGQRQFNLQNLLQQRGLQQQGLMGRAGFFEGQRQFENQFGQNQQTGNRQFMLNLANFQNQLRQQAFMNRQAISGQAGSTGLGLATSRQGITGGQTQFNPANQFSQMGTGLNTLGTGLQQFGSFLGF